MIQIAILILIPEIKLMKLTILQVVKMTEWTLMKLTK